MVAEGSPGQQEGAANAWLFLSQQGALYSTGQGNETRARVEARANLAEKASRNQLLHCRNQGKQLVRAVMSKWHAAALHHSAHLGLQDGGVFPKLRAHLAVMETDFFSLS